MDELEVPALELPLYIRQEVKATAVMNGLVQVSIANEAVAALVEAVRV